MLEPQESIEHELKEETKRVAANNNLNYDWGIEGRNVEAQVAKRAVFEQFLNRGMTVISERSIEQTEMISDNN